MYKLAWSSVLVALPISLGLILGISIHNPCYSAPRFNFKPDGFRSNEHHKAISNSEFLASPWLARIEDRVRYSRYHAPVINQSSAPKKPNSQLLVSNITCTFELNKDGAFENISVLPVPGESTDPNIANEAIRQLKSLSGIQPLKDELAENTKIQIIVHFGKYPEFDIRQELTKS